MTQPWLVATKSLFAVVIIAAIGSAAACDRGPRLETITYGGNGPPTMVLLHGYGSSAEQWAPFTQTIRLPPPGRFVFPQAPDPTSPPDGPTGGRGWWRLGLAANIPAGKSVPDLSATQPPGLKVAASLLEELLDSIERSPGGPVILGGYSQGAMVASEVAFRTDARIDALVLLSGTLVDENSWERAFHLRRGTPVFLSHGRSDPILPFEVAERFRSKLEAAGLRVTWVPFHGGHEIPAAVVSELNAFLAAFSQTN